MATRELPDYVRHILDERTTNGMIYENKHDRKGNTLCGELVFLVQRVPDQKEAPTFVTEHGHVQINGNVSRHYSDTWALDHWFNHTISNNYYIGCPKCLAHITKAVEIGAWDGVSYPDPTCEECEEEFTYNDKKPSQRLCEPCAQDQEEERA